jgi:1-deoxyxylulose-5-phosphate synthase
MMAGRRLGRSEIAVEPFCLGTMNLGSATPDAEATRILELALSEGVRFFNLADVAYAGRSEVLIGRVLERSPHRDDVVLSVEISGPDMGVPERPNLSAAYIRRACDLALGRLQREHIDLYLIPRPSNEIPIEETLGVLTELVAEGKVRAVGCSTFPAWKVMEAIAASERHGYARIVVDESPYNVLDRRIENEFVPFALAHDVGILAWAPLAQGMLASTYRSGEMPPATSRAVRIGGKYRDRITPEGIAFGERFDALARELGLSSAQLAFCWTRDQPGIVAPVVGPRTLEHTREILQARKLRIDDAARAACDELNPPGSVVTDFFNTAPWMRMRVTRPAIAASSSPVALS